MRCRRCDQKALVHLRQHNAAFCRDCFLTFFTRQVERAVEKERMFSREEPVLVAVSGGKDSLALWEVLVDLGYDATGLYLALGIGDYSSASEQKVRAFAEKLGRRLLVVGVDEEVGGIPGLARNTNRPACAACGTAKRYFFDRIAQEHGFQVLATGHNLDDEAARLLGNVMRWQARFLGKQSPVLRERHVGFIRKVKPLFRISEYETAVYSFLRGIDYVVEECPNAEGASQLVFKDALNRIEASMPGSKLSFLQEFLRNGRPLFEAAENAGEPNACSRCGMPCFGETCSHCSLLEEVARKRERALKRRATLSSSPAS